jgi:hypothetical protein
MIQHRGRDIGNVLREIAQSAVGGDATRPFGATFSVAYEFHGAAAGDAGRPTSMIDQEKRDPLEAAKEWVEQNKEIVEGQWLNGITS